MKILNCPFLGIWIILLFASCTKAQVPAFDQDHAFEYLRKQCAFGPRNPGSEGHKKCLAFMVAELQNSADVVAKQSFTHTDSKAMRSYGLTNVIASFGKQGERIMLCAHWDTRPWADYDADPKNHDKPIMGANDAASGVAVLLEIARILKNKPPPRGVDIVLFDGEDFGDHGKLETWCQGSRFFARQKRFDYMPKYAILIDMIGDRDLHIPVEGHSQMYAPDLVDKVWTMAESLGLSVFDRALGPVVIDDHMELLKVGRIKCNLNLKLSYLSRRMTLIQTISRSSDQLA